jgi:hypothetical protein
VRNNSQLKISLLAWTTWLTYRLMLQRKGQFLATKKYGH